MRTLVIVESPGKVARLQAIFDGVGDGYQVVATGGHICDLPPKWQPEPPDFVPVFELTERGREVVARLRAEVAKVDHVILATDPDREGEAIAAHVTCVLELKNPIRIEFHSIDPDAVRAALAKRHGVRFFRVEAQKARRVLDRVIGYGLSQAVSKYLHQEMHFGRVQAPAVRLVVERNRTIRRFKSVHHYGARVHFANGWSADWWPAAPGADAAEPCTDRAFAARVAAMTDLVVGDVDVRQELRAAPTPFDTVGLITAADAELRMRPDVTMDAAQKLFEAGSISYHRTDSCTLSAYAKHKLARYCTVAQLPLGAVAVANPADAHEAIRPNDFGAREAGTTAAEQSLYRLIWSRAVASAMADGMDTVIHVPICGRDPTSQRELLFSAHRETCVTDGWRAIYHSAHQASGMPGPGASLNPIPNLHPHERVNALGGEVLEAHTEPPARFRDATLIAELARLGIGRPSTYVTMLQKIVGDTRTFLARNDAGFLSAHILGVTLVKTLVGKSRFIDFDYTREMEAQLHAVEQGKRVYAEVVSRGWDQLTADVAELRGARP